MLELAADVEFVQFVDGDCEIVDGWVDAATNAMRAKPRAALVCGRRRERYPEASIYNKLCDIEWDTPGGTVKYCGGDVLARVSALREVGGYDPSVIAGEEPEMCVRLRARGWTIERIDAEMTLHDAAMSRFGQWWKRNVRAGHAYAEGFAMHGGEPERHRQREVSSIAVWGIVVPMEMVSLTIILAVIAPRWAWIGLLPLVLYPLLFVKVLLRQRRRLRLRDAALYGAAVTLGKFPQAIGMMKYWFGRASGKRSGVIEYKGAAVAAEK